MINLYEMYIFKHFLWSLYICKSFRWFRHRCVDNYWRQGLASKQPQWASGEVEEGHHAMWVRRPSDSQSQLSPVTLHRPPVFIQFPHLHIDRKDASLPSGSVYRRLLIHGTDQESISRWFRIKHTLFYFKTHPWTFICLLFYIGPSLLYDFGLADHNSALSFLCKPCP